MVNTIIIKRVIIWVNHSNNSKCITIRYIWHNVHNDTNNKNEYYYLRLINFFYWLQLLEEIDCAIDMHTIKYSKTVINCD